MNIKAFIHIKAISKKGSHVGMIISFLIFALFLIFLYSILEPTTKIPDKKLDLEYLNSVIIEKISANLTSVTVNSPGKTCLKISDSEVGLTDVNSIAKDKDGNIIKSKHYEGDLIVESSKEEFLFVSYSTEQFKEDETEISTCDVNPVIKTISTEEYAFETKIFDIRDYYEQSYNGLKNELNIPSSTEFDFSFAFSNGTIISGEKNSHGNVYVKNNYIQYIDKEANISPGVLTIEIW